MSTEESTAEEGCVKCGHSEATVDKIATAGSGISKLMDLQNRGFKAVSCANCGYTELYKTDSGTSDVLDVFLG